MASETDWYSERDIATTFAKGLRVLAAFDETRRSLTIAEIVEVTGLDKASVRRSIVTLAHLGYVAKSGRSFALTPRVLGLAGAYLRSNQIGSLIQPVLNRYAALCGHAISLGCRDGTVVTYLAQSSLAGSEVSFGFTIGSRLPLLHTALGRAILSFSDTELAEALSRTAPRHRYTEQTRMDPDEILSEIALARTRSFAAVDGEFEAGVTGLAVPIGPLGQASAAIGVSGPAGPFGEADFRRSLIGTLHQCAVELDRSGVLAGLSKAP